jgi:hypothetical protein
VLNGTWIITRTDANNFTFAVTSAPGSAISGFSTTVYPIQIFANYNIAKISPQSAATNGVYDVTFASGVTFPTYTTYSGSTPTVSPAYWVNGSIQAVDASSSWPLMLRISHDVKTVSGFRVKAAYVTPTAAGGVTVSGQPTGLDFPAVFLSVYSL